MKTPLNMAAALCLGFCLAAAATAAPPEGKGKPEKHEKHAGKGNQRAHHEPERNEPAIVVHISAADARRIAIGHQAVGYAALPPGIRKNLARGKPLPPGIAKKMVPQPVLAQLPQYPGYEWQVAGSDLVLIALATAIVTEVLVGVFD